MRGRGQLPSCSRGGNVGSASNHNYNHTQSRTPNWPTLKHVQCKAVSPSRVVVHTSAPAAMSISIASAFPSTAACKLRPGFRGPGGCTSTSEMQRRRVLPPRQCTKWQRRGAAWGCEHCVGIAQGRLCSRGGWARSGIGG